MHLSSLLPLARATGLLGLVLLLASCGSRQPVSGGHVLIDERMLACDTLLEELAQVDTATEPEETLQRRLDQTLHAVEPCHALWLRDQRHPASTVFANHRANQLRLRALSLERALSQRFDNNAHFCDILRETFQVIVADLTELELALGARNLKAETRTTLQQLVDLDVEALDVLMLSTDRLCVEETRPQQR